MAKSTWQCCRCMKMHDVKADAETCEKSHGPFVKVIRRGVEIDSENSVVLSHPKLGDLIITAEAMMKAVDSVGIEYKGRYL